MGIDFRRPGYVTGFRWGKALIWAANGSGGGEIANPPEEPIAELVTPQSLSTVDGDNTLTVTAEVDDISLDVTDVKHK